MIEFLVSADHPSLEGHFQGNPIVPGVTLLQEIKVRIEDEWPDLSITGIMRAKFIEVLKPNQTVHVVVKLTDLGLKFTCHRQGTQIATGHFKISMRSLE
jgi:3-hydroxymyristoyl/3-hydroxydecanoyl-(acyl carrier protein) dehydratase